MQNKKNSITPTQPSLKGSKIPSGHIIINSKYQNSPVSRSLSGKSIYAGSMYSIFECYLILDKFVYILDIKIFSMFMMDVY